MSLFSPTDLTSIKWSISYSINPSGRIFVEQNEEIGNSIREIENEHSNIIILKGDYSYYRPVATEQFLAFFAEKDGQLSLLTLDLKTRSINKIIENYNTNIYSIIPYDNEHILYTRINDKGRNELAITHYRNNQSVKTLFEIPHGNSISTMKVDISKEKNLLFFLRNREKSNFTLCITSPEEKSYRTIFQPSNTVFPLSAKWSPNGKYICCLYREISTHKIAILDLENDKTIYIDLPSVTEQPIWYEDNEQLLIIVDEWPYTNLYIYNFKEQQLRKLDVNFKGIISQAKLHNNKLYFIGTSPNIPSTLFSWDSITNLKKVINNDIVEFSGLKEVVVKIPSYEKFKIPCIFYKARINSKASVIMLHGGPSGAWLANWSPVIHLLVNNGFNVLLVNPRGSTIRTEPLPLMSKGDFGVKDCRDVLTCIQWLIKEGYGQRGDIRLYGHSYGGFLAYQTAKVSKEISSIVITSSYLETYALLNSGNPNIRKFTSIAFFEEQLEEKVVKVNCPILQVNGTNDTQIPINIAKQMFYHLRDSRNKFIELQKEGHAFKKKESMVYWIKEALDFFKQY